MAGQALFQQKKLRARRRKRLLWALALVVSAVLILFFALAWLSHLDALEIRDVAVDGNSRVSADELKAVAEELLSGNYLGLFSRTNILLYPKDAIVETVSALPAIESVNVFRSGMNGLSVSVKERQEAALWCEGAFGDRARCSAVDGNGLIFARSTGTISDEIVYRGTVATLDEKSRDVYVSPDFKKIHFFMNQLAGLSIEPREAEIGQAGYMTVLLGGGGTLLINTADDLSAVLSNIALVISDRSVAPDLSAFLRDLDYIKLDSGDKVVYKMKQ
jgi:hypothetical protein